MSKTSIMQLKPSEVYEFITAALSCRQVPYISGPAAIGKSQIVKQVADDANALMIDLRLSQMLSEDMTGLPERDEQKGKAIYLPFETFPLEGDEIPEGYNGWMLFLDELSSASEEVLAASYSLILDRTVGGKKIHPKCLIVAAGNRASDSAIARELPDTLITRMLPIEMKVNTKDWLIWAENHNKSNEHVVEFIRKNPNMLYAFTKASDREELETYATPRGWEKVFAHMNFHEANATTKVVDVEDSAGIPLGQKEMSGEPITDLVYNMMASAVGVSAARAFRETYDESIQLPYPWEVAQSPSSTRIPQSHIGKATLIKDLADEYIKGNDEFRDGLITYTNRIGGEYSELFVKHVKNQLKATPSDNALIEKLSKRLNIDPLLGTVSNSNPDDDPPF